jgi:hypothetical protein
MLEKQIGFSRIWTGYRALRDSDPETVREVTEHVREYDADLRALRLEDHELDGDPPLRSGLVSLLGQALLVYVLLPPVLVLGLIVNFPAALICVLLARSLAGASKDEASLKVVIGSVLFPITWILVAVLVAVGAVRFESVFGGLSDVPIVAGLLAAALCAIGGCVAVSYRRLSAETLRSLRVRFTRRSRARQILRLRKERRLLHDWLVGLGEGLELPGTVTSDGRVIPTWRGHGGR